MSTLNVEALLATGDRTGLWTNGSQPLNVPLLRKTLEYIEAHPEDWVQDQWVCDSGMCYAGHACALAGADFAPPLRNGAIYPYVTGPDYDYVYGMETSWGRHVSDFAAYHLGISPGEDARLFFGENSLDDLRGMVASLEADGHLADWGVEYDPSGQSEWDGSSGL